MYKKIALIILVLALGILAYGFYFMFQRDISPLKTGSNQPTDQAEQASQTADSELADNNIAQEIKQRAASQRSKEQLDKEIESQIRLKANKIMTEAQDRQYTSDELSFLDNPRQNIIDNMEKNGQLSEAELKLLQ